MKITTCQDCGRRIFLALVIPTRIPRDSRRHYIPLDLGYDPARSPIPPSHALSLDGRRCHPITDDWPLEDYENPALTHFATCPRRRPVMAQAAQEGTR